MSRRCIRRRGARVSYVDAFPGEVVEWDVVEPLAGSLSALHPE